MTKKKVSVRKQPKPRVRKVMPKWSLIPRSRAENSYQLLDEVVAMVVAEPKRLDMGTWALVKGVTPEDAPSCGTVGCIAGWMDIMVNRQKVFEHIFADHNGVWNEALNLLPLRLRHESNKLFTTGIDRLPKAGTTAHVDAVVRRIRDFQHAWGPQLLDHKITITR